MAIRNWERGPFGERRYGFLALGLIHEPGIRQEIENYKTLPAFAKMSHKGGPIDFALLLYDLEQKYVVPFTDPGPNEIMERVGDKSH